MFLRRFAGLGSSLSEDGLQQCLIPRSLRTARPALIGTTTTTTTTTAAAVTSTIGLLGPGLYLHMAVVDMGKPAEVVL